MSRIGWWGEFLRFLSPRLDRELIDRWQRANHAETKADGYRKQLIENGIRPTNVFLLPEGGVMLEMTWEEDRRG